MRAGDIPNETEVLVIGGGPGGYVAAIRAGQLGLDVTLVEKNDVGGVCLNRGCIPSKALLSGTSLAYEASEAAEIGVHADPEIDLATMVAWKDDVVQQLTGGVKKLCKANQVTLIDGHAAFDGKHSATITPIDGDEQTTMEFENAIIATGSRPIELPGFSFEDDAVIDSSAVLSLEQPPENIVVIGAGYVGMELATVLARAGTDVTVLEMLDSALPGFPEDLTRPVRSHLQELGVDFQFGEGASEYRESAEGIVVETETDDGQTKEYPTEQVFVAVGREPVAETVNPTAIGLELTDSGYIETDEQARTELDHVFAVGDVAGEPMLAHEASAAGEVAAEVIAGEQATLTNRAIPAAVYTDPEIGTVGMAEDAANDQGIETIVGEFPLRASGRALTLRETDGFVRLIADEESGVVLGGQVVAPEASELIAEIGLAIETSATLSDVAGTVHTHPTLSESVMEAAKKGLGQAIHTLNR